MKLSKLQKAVKLQMVFQIIEKNQNQGNFVQYREKKVHLIYYSPKIEKYSREKNLKILKESTLITKTP